MDNWRMDIQDTRRIRLAQLIKEKYETQAKYIAATGHNQGEISALLKSKSFGEKKARKIEADTGMPKGWLDSTLSGFGPATAAQRAMADDSDTQIEDMTERRHESRRARDLEFITGQASDEVMIPQYNAGGAMGNGLVLDGLAGIIKSWRVDHEWLRLNVRNHTGVKNLCIVTGFGPSMRPMFNPGDPLLLDKGINSFDHEDAIYFFRVGNYGFIKTVQRIPQPRGGMLYRAKSKNPDYDHFDLTADMDFEVFGKILTVWRSEQF